MLNAQDRVGETRFKPDPPWQSPSDTAGFTQCFRLVMLSTWVE